MANQGAYLSQMDEIIERKRSEGLVGMRLFVDSSLDRTPEEMAKGYCRLEAAKMVGRVKNVTKCFF